MRFWSWVGIACAFLSFVISISIVIYLCCIGECFGIENISFGDTSVAILCAIVGLLIGWNIYTVIDIHKIKEEFSALKVEVNDNMERSLIESHRSMALMYNSKTEPDKSDILYFLLFHYINMLIHQSRVKLYDDCRRIITQIMMIGQIKVIQPRRDSIFQLLGQIQNTNKISNYEDLMDYLSYNLIEESMVKPSETDSGDIGDKKDDTKG